MEEVLGVTGAHEKEDEQEMNLCFFANIISVDIYHIFLNNRQLNASYFLM